MEFSHRDVLIGRVSGRYCGYKKHSAYLAVSVRVEKFRNFTMTVNHKLVGDPLRLSISAGVWNRRRTDFVICGQCRDALDNMVSYAPGWDKDKVSRLREIWDEWHLNDMKASCVHQSDDNHETCELGYEWGTAWLVRELPLDIVEDLRVMFEGSD